MDRLYNKLGKLINSGAHHYLSIYCIYENILVTTHRAQ